MLDHLCPHALQGITRSFRSPRGCTRPRGQLSRYPYPGQVSPFALNLLTQVAHVHLAAKLHRPEAPLRHQCSPAFQVLRYFIFDTPSADQRAKLRAEQVIGQGTLPFALATVSPRQSHGSLAFRPTSSPRLQSGTGRDRLPYPVLSAVASDSLREKPRASAKH